MDRSIKINDFIQLDSGVYGVVKEITVRYTRICTNDNIDILVPNAEFVSGKVINYTHQEPFRRMHIPFGVAYGSDKELTRKAALEAADTVSHTLKNVKGRAPQVWLTNFGDSSLDFELVVWITEASSRFQKRILSDYLWEIETNLKKYGIEIPFPQRDIHVRSSQVDFSGKK
jgi:small-conductance mechanosensitive channel